MEEIEKTNSTSEYLKGIVLNLPEGPGIYQYLNKEEVIIYVGKAKNLKRRVYSYFSKDHQSAKTRMLVSKIADIRYIVVNSEEDALLLENNLIKKYKPRYNVLLKDDKTYPSICISNEYFPRIYKTRKIIRDGSNYFGPYSHVPSMMALLELIKKLYPLRTCHLALTPENIAQGKFKVCLEYHIKNCKGPCIGKQSHEEYMQQIAQARELLKGNTQKVSNALMEEMKSSHRCILHRNGRKYGIHQLPAHYQRMHQPSLHLRIQGAHEREQGGVAAVGYRGNARTL